MIRTLQVVIVLAATLVGLPLVGGGTAASADEPSWTVLFDGTSLDGWRGYSSEEVPQGWRIQDGVLHRASGGGDIVTVDQFGDFELSLEWKISPGGNSGIIYRARLGDAAPYISGPEYQVLDNAASEDPRTSAGALYDLYPTDVASAKPAGQWNTARLIVRGNHIEHWLNGVQVVSCEMHDDDWNQRVAASKFAAWEPFARSETGHIALQDHGNEVWYRNIKIRRL